MNALVLAVALTIAGECDDIGHGCELSVARVLANRVGAPGYATTIDGALAGFYGRAEAPTPEAIRVARLLWADPDAVRDGVYYYAYSDDDRARMGWRRGDARICNETLCVNLSQDWPRE